MSTIQRVLILATALSVFASAYIFKMQFLTTFIEPGDPQGWFIPDQAEEKLKSYLQPNLGKQVLHFGEPDCLCNVVTDRHIKTLTNHAKSKEIPITWISKTEFSPSIESDFVKQIPNHPVKRTPAIAIFDQNQKLVYFGPYGFGAFCSVRPTNFLKNIINTLDEGHKSLLPFLNLAGEGCFCQNT